VHVSRLDVVWQTCRDEVLSEVQKILDEGGLPQSQAFQCRTSAAKRVFDHMDEERKQEILQKVQEYKTKGNDPEIQHQ
jgi:hypothetical protein